MLETEPKPLQPNTIDVVTSGGGKLPVRGTDFFMARLLFRNGKSPVDVATILNLPWAAVRSIQRGLASRKTPKQ